MKFSRSKMLKNFVFVLINGLKNEIFINILKTFIYNKYKKCKKVDYGSRTRNHE